MAELKTRVSDAPIDDLIANLIGKRREEALILLELFAKQVSVVPKIWGGKMVGYGRYHYCYDSGREGDWFVTGFAPAKANLTLYIMPGFTELEPLLVKLGKHKLGSSCLYINKLADVDLDVLAEIVKSSCELMQARYQDIEI